MVTPPRLERGTPRSTIKGDRLSAADRPRQKIAAKPNKLLEFLQATTTLSDRARQPQTGASAYFWRIPLETRRHGEAGRIDGPGTQSVEGSRETLRGARPRRDRRLRGGLADRALSYVLRFRFQNASKKVTLGRFDPDANGLAENSRQGARGAKSVDGGAQAIGGRLGPRRRQEGRPTSRRASHSKGARRHTGGQGATARRLRQSCRRFISPRMAATCARPPEKRLPACSRRNWAPGKSVASAKLKRRTFTPLLDAVTARGAEITANRLHSYLRHFFVWAKGRKMIAASPLDGVCKPTSEKNRARSRALDDAELGRGLERRVRARLSVRAFFSTGDFAWRSSQ